MARRLIRDNLPSIDIVIEILDAKVPLSPENPEVTSIVGSKPLLSILNKASLTD
jgi:ribosome biogenesis GTPase A